MPTPEQIKQAHAFMRGLFGTLEDGDGHLLIWRLKDKSSAWFVDPEKAASFAVGKPDIYVGTGLRARPLDKGRRGGSDDVVAIPGIWLDLDCEGDNRPSREEARKLLTSAFPQAPTLINDTGGGFHPWWLFKELWKFEDRAAAARLVARWQGHFIAIAKEQGFRIDNTSDLARVMRIPGTYNDKYDEQREVVTIESKWTQRYEPEDLLEFLDSIETDDARKNTTVIPFKPSADGKDYQPPDAELLASRCPWLRHCRDDAAKLPEPEWYAMLSILSRCVGGEDVAQRWSESYPAYTATETELKVLQSLKAGPALCATVAERHGAEWCVSCNYRGQVNSPISVGMFPAPRDLPTVVVLKDAAPPQQKWEALRTNDPKAAKSFDRKRLKLNEAGCEMSLATLAALAAWTAQEICDLLIFHHVRHKEIPRPADYYARVIAIGIGNAEKIQAQSSVSDLATLGSAEGMTGNVEHDKKFILDCVSKWIGVEVLSFLRFNTEPPIYKIETDVGTINLGSKCFNYSQFKQAAYDTTRKVVPRIKPKQLDELLQALADVATDVDTGPESSDAKAVELWLEAYLIEQKTPSEEGEVILAVRDKRPFIKDGVTFFFGPFFKRWLKISEFDVDITARAMGVILRDHGCKPKSLSVAGKTYRVWEMPKGEKEDGRYKSKI